MIASILCVWAFVLPLLKNKVSPKLTMSILFMASWFLVSSGKFSLVQYVGMRLGSMEENESVPLIESRLSLIKINTRPIFELDISFWSSTHFRDAVLPTKISCEEATNVGAVQYEESMVSKPSSTPAEMPAASHCQLSLLPVAIAWSDLLQPMMNQMDALKFPTIPTLGAVNIYDCQYPLCMGICPPFIEK